MTAPASKICVVCHKDVSNAKRVKDPQGHYFCAECHEKALQRNPGVAKTAAAAGGAPKPPGVKPLAGAVAVPPKPEADDDDLLPLVPVATKPVPPAAKGDAPASKGPPKIPEFCPACGTKTLPGRRLCFKCNRDVTQLDKLVALRAQENAGPTKEERFANVAGVVMKIGLIVFVVGVVAFILWGIWLRVAPIDTFDGYPTTREKVVRDFLQNINEGTDSSYDKAFKLISFRERVSNLGNDELKYKIQLKQMREDFIKKYGDDWHSKYQLELVGPDDNYADDEVDYSLKLGEDKYRVATQVQIAVDAAMVNMLRASKLKPVYPENGKNHFGIMEFQGYSPYDKRIMVERSGVKGRLRPEDF